MMEAEQMDLFTDTKEISELKATIERREDVIRILEDDIDLYMRRNKLLVMILKTLCKNKLISDRCGKIDCRTCDIKRNILLKPETKGEFY